MIGDNLLLLLMMERCPLVVDANCSDKAACRSAACIPQRQNEGHV